VSFRGLCQVTRFLLRCFQIIVEEMHDMVEWQWRVIPDDEGIGTPPCWRSSFFNCAVRKGLVSLCCGADTSGPNRPEARL
jgi:hypothetical protein